MLKKTFLYKVFEKDKPLFAFFLLFIIGQIFFTYKQVENTPFFHFGMYSAIHSPKPSYTVYHIKLSEKDLQSNDFADAQREVIYNTIAAYDGLQQLNFRDTLDKVISHRFLGNIAQGARTALLNTQPMDKPYQMWLFQYIADMRMIQTPALEVTKNQVHYLPNGNVAAIDTPKTLFNIRYE